MKTGSGSADDFIFEITTETKKACMLNTQRESEDRLQCCRQNRRSPADRDECYTYGQKAKKWSPQLLRQNIVRWVMSLYSLITVFIFSPNSLFTRLHTSTIRTGDDWRKLDPSQRGHWTEVNLLSILRRNEQDELKIADLLSSWNSHNKNVWRSQEAKTQRLDHSKRIHQDRGRCSFFTSPSSSAPATTTRALKWPPFLNLKSLIGSEANPCKAKPNLEAV